MLKEWGFLIPEMRNPPRRQSLTCSCFGQPKANPEAPKPSGRGSSQKFCCPLPRDPKNQLGENRPLEPYLLVLISVIDMPTPVNMVSTSFIVHVFFGFRATPCAFTPSGFLETMWDGPVHRNSTQVACAYPLYYCSSPQLFSLSFKSIHFVLVVCSFVCGGTHLEEPRILIRGHG